MEPPVAPPPEPSSFEVTEERDGQGEEDDAVDNKDEDGGPASGRFLFLVEEDLCNKDDDFLKGRMSTALFSPNAGDSTIVLVTAIVLGDPAVALL